MKRLIAAMLTLVTILTLGTAFAGGRNCEPVCWLDFWVENNSDTPVVIQVYSEKGSFWAELAPRQSFGYGIDFEIPPGGLPDDWFAHGGEVVVHVNDRVITKHAKCLAELEEILVTVNPKKKKEKEGVFKVEVDLIE